MKATPTIHLLFFLNLAERSLFCHLSTHLVLTSRIARSFNRFNERYGAVVAFLDRLAFGVLLQDQFGRVVHKNGSMQDVLDTSTGLFVSCSGFVSFRVSSEVARFKAFLASAKLTLEGAVTPELPRPVAV